MADLQHYIESGEVPSDPAELAALYQQAIDGEANADKQVEPVEKTDSAATGATEQAKPEVKTEVESENEPAGVASKDGNHIIPYDVLKSERQQRQEAERNAQALRDEIERLKAAPATPEVSAFEAMTAEQLAELQEYFPEQYAAIKAQQDALIANQQRLNELEQLEAKRQADARQQIALTVQEEIDNNPVLSHWQRNNPDIYAKCIDMDNTLLKDPDMAKLPLADRFARVARAMTQIYGNPVPTTETEQPTEKKSTMPAATTKPVINSLSDIKGGEAPEASERQRLEESSAAEIGDRLLSMSEEQRTNYLNSL